MPHTDGAVAAETPFEIPELPSGQRLHLNLLSNWGDPNFIGLNAIEIFTEDGNRAEVQRITSTAQHTVGSLDSIFVESISCTDEEQMWKAELEETVSIDIHLLHTIRVAMIRIWNYNESRVHAQIGVRELEIWLDDCLIFRGEINPSYTTADEYEPMGDTVLFTTDETILEAIAEHDVCLLPDTLMNVSSLDVVAGDNEPVSLTPFRPPTAEQATIAKIAVERPCNSARTTEEKHEDNNKVKVIHLELLANWGHPDMIGLAGIDFIGDQGFPVDLHGVTITAAGCESGVQNLLNGTNLTRKAGDMWSTAFDQKQKKPPAVVITFPQPTVITGLSIWNYNVCSELSFAGVRMMHLYVNGKLAVPNVLLRKAPGYVYFDFVQDVMLDSAHFVRPTNIRPVTNSIGGFIFQLRLLSTWGDEFYIGLNGIELYNRKDERIRIKTQNLAAFPESVNILPAVERDPRTSENLINGINDTDKAVNMWLTPLLPNRCARVFFIFDVPTYVSRMVIYNYRKTPERGVRHVSVSVDDLIVFSGEVPESTASRTGTLSVDLREQEH